MSSYFAATSSLQSALNAMTMHEALNITLPFMPRKPAPPTYTDSTHYAHVAAPMIHPTTGEIISSYKRLMNDPATAEVWQTAFGKDFGGMAQGDLKTGQKGTDSVRYDTQRNRYCKGGGTQMDLCTSCGGP